MNGTGQTLENVIEELLRRIVREEIQAAISGNGNHGADQLLKAEEAAKRWSVPVTWIRDMARRGELPHIRLGHYIRFKPEDLDRFIKELRK